MNQIKVYTLGKLIIEQDGQVLSDFVSNKTILLLVYLAMFPEKHAREKLAMLLWSETTDVQAAKNLRTVLSNLRQQSPDLLETSRKLITINPSLDVWVDASEFEIGCAEYLDMLLDPLPRMQYLAALYKGDFLANVKLRQAEYLQEWVYEKQLSLQQCYIQLLHRIVDHTLKHEQYEIGLPYARDLIAQDPLWEVAQRQLMLLLAHMGRANDALHHYEQFEAYIQDELDTPPEEETTTLYQAIKAGLIQKAAPPSITLPDIPYVEPSQDVEFAQRMLNTPQCHLLTIFGISGIGKTALATQIAFHRQHLYRDGAHILLLGEAHTADNLTHLLANALGITRTTNQSLNQMILEHLKNCEMLLVFDNYEHLPEENQLIQQLLQHAPNVQVIITAQTPLNLYREWLLPLKGLSIPPDDEASSGSFEAVQLFERIAIRLDPGFDVRQHLDEVVSICRMVDGLPLGILIAAGWVQYMSPKEIMAMMQKDLLQVTTMHRDMPSRHQSFQNLVNAMLKHLSHEDQEALTCLTVFEGSFDHPAALAVANIQTPDFIRLVDKGLLQRVGNSRYSIHNIIRQVFLSDLRASPLFEVVLDRYTSYFESWCDTFNEQNYPLHKRMHLLDIEQHNLWLVKGLSETKQQTFLLRIAPALQGYWIDRGYRARGIIPLLQAAGSNPAIDEFIRVMGLLALAILFQRTGENDNTQSVCEQVLEIEITRTTPYLQARVFRLLSEVCTIRNQFETANQHLFNILAMETLPEYDPRLESLFTYAYQDLSEIAMSQGDYPTALHYIEIAKRRWEEKGETLRSAVLQSYSGIIAIKQGEYEKALATFSSILTEARTANNETLVTSFSSYMGIAAMKMGDYIAACGLFVESLTIALRIHRQTTIINLMEQFAQLAIMKDHPMIAAQLLGFAFSMRTRLNQPVTPHNRAEIAQRLQHVQDTLGDQFDKHYALGCGLGVATAVQVAFSVADMIGE